MKRNTIPISGQLPYSRPVTSIVNVRSYSIFQSSDGRSVAPGMEEEDNDFEWIQ